MALWDAVDAVERNPDRVGGTWVFRGTRIPVVSLFENLRDGATIEEFLEWFPGVTRTQVEVVIQTGILSGLEVPEDLWEELLSRDPRFRERIAQARESLREGQGLSIEQLREKYDL